MLTAGRDSTPGSRTALAELCERYWPPLYSFARRRGYSVEQAQDLTQAFFARFLEKRYVQAADPQRGRFRSFLLASFKPFLANERDREHAQKRGGGQLPIALEFDTAETRYAAEPRGGSLTVTSDIPDLDDVMGPCGNDWENCTSSIRVSRQ